MAEFFHMGGYAFYVWLSYGLAALVVVVLIWWSVRDYHVQKALAAQLEALAGGRVRRAASAPRGTKKQDKERQ